MQDVKTYLQRISQHCSVLKVSLESLAKVEGRIQKEALKSTGFLFKHYTLNYNKITAAAIKSILQGVGTVHQLALQIQTDIIDDKITTQLEEIEQDYKRLKAEHLHTDQLQKEAKELEHYASLLLTRAKRLQMLLKENYGDKTLHKAKAEKEHILFFKSFEHIMNKVLYSLTYIEHLSNEINTFEENAYFVEPKTYGRIMSKKEYDKTKRTGCLQSTKDLTPVFDAPTATLRRIKGMNSDQRKNFASQIGIVGGTHVVFFSTRLRPINKTGIPQKNGLREFKFPKGTQIKNIQVA